MVDKQMRQKQSPYPPLRYYDASVATVDTVCNVKSVVTIDPPEPARGYGQACFSRGAAAKLSCIAGSN